MTRRHALLATFLAALVGVGCLLVREEPPSRVIVLVARDMAFYLETPGGEPLANPTLAVRAGERIEIVLRNEDPGMHHDLVVEAWSLHSDPVAFGEMTRVRLEVPDAAGETDYLCSFHPRMMRGEILVAGAALPPDAVALGGD